MINGERVFPDKYQFRSLQIGETHFLFRSESHSVHSNLAAARRRYPELRQMQFSCQDTRSGVIIRRVR